MEIFTGIVILIMLAVILHSTISVVCSFFPDKFKNNTEGVYSLPFYYKINGILKRVRTFYVFFVGKNWKDYSFWPRLALLYFFLLPNFSMMRIAVAVNETGWMFHDSNFMILGMNFWVFSNIIGDYISYNVSRALLDKYLNKDNPGFFFAFKIVFIDLTIATILMMFVVFFTNVAHTVALFQNYSEFIKEIQNSPFSLNGLKASFGIFVGNEPVIVFPGFIIITFSTFFPTLFWLISLTISLAFMPVKIWMLNSVKEMTASGESIFNYRFKYLSLLVGSCAALYAVLTFYK